MKSRRAKILVWIIIIIVLGLISYGFYFGYQNTSFLRTTAPKEGVTENNQGTPQTKKTDFSTLEPQKLIIPKQYQTGALAKERILNLPPQFEISVFAAGLSEPRFFTFDSQNNLIVADKGAGKIFLLKDTNQDGVAEEQLIVDSNLNVVHSVYFYQGDLFSGEEDKIVVYRDLQTGGNYSQKEILVANLPAGGGHQTRTVLVGPDEKLYVSVGSSCNLCEEREARRASVVRYNLDGSGEEIFASGLRNSVGIEFKDNVLWSVDNGRDLIGDDLPPEEVNILKQGKNYGWPYCYGNGITNPEYPQKENFCEKETEFPKYNMQAHSAPLGMAFIPEESNNQKVLFPQEMAQNLFIGFHGSWNRTVPTGYKVVRIDTAKDSSETINFITGWLEQDGSAWGRPVDVGFDQEGVMYISDDKAGVIYRVVYKQ